jgi:hypothetical protein
LKTLTKTVQQQTRQQKGMPYVARKDYSVIQLENMIAEKANLKGTPNPY